MTFLYGETYIIWLPGCSESKQVERAHSLIVSSLWWPRIWAYSTPGQNYHPILLFLFSIYIFHCCKTCLVITLVSYFSLWVPLQEMIFLRIVRKDHKPTAIIIPHSRISCLCSILLIILENWWHHGIHWWFRDWSYFSLPNGRLNYTLDTKFSTRILNHIAVGLKYNDVWWV